jgi:hypothetical protein
MSRQPVVEPAFQWVDIDLLRVNSYNANRMSDEMFDKAIESIHRFGFVDPITVREAVLGFEIIDGEHRWLAAKDHSGACSGNEHVGLRQIPITNLGKISDHIARQLTIVLNETRGESEPKKLGLILIDLLAAEPMAELTTLLPFSQGRIEELAELPKVNWDDPTPKPHGSGKERWVERVYRIPADAVETFDEAMEAAKAETGGSDWQALVALAERYLD